MSHFTVLVIGEDPEDQLARYDEELEVEGEEYNPDAKWDWYVLGGRWTGFFKLKEGATGEIGDPGVMTEPAKPGYADAALKKDIDFDWMRTEARENAAKRYDAIRRIIGKYPEAKTFEQLREAFDATKARELYWQQPVIKALQNAGYSCWGSEIFDECKVPREKYLKRIENSAVETFAFVRNGEWYASGEMGWWGVVSNEKDPEEWSSEFNKMLDALPEDTLMSLFDCHI